MNENDLYKFISRLSDKAEDAARKRQDIWRERPADERQQPRARIMRKVTEAGHDR